MEWSFAYDATGHEAQRRESVKDPADDAFQGRQKQCADADQGSDYAETAREGAITGRGRRVADHLTLGEADGKS